MELKCLDPKTGLNKCAGTLKLYCDTSTGKCTKPTKNNDEPWGYSSKLAKAKAEGKTLIYNKENKLYGYKEDVEAHIAAFKSGIVNNKKEETTPRNIDKPSSSYKRKISKPAENTQISEDVYQFREYVPIDLKNIKSELVENFKQFNL
jgi:hypothetical protein